MSAAFDAGEGFSRASAVSTEDSSWRLQYPASLASTTSDGPRLHWLLVLLQVLAIVSGVVLAMPTRKVQP